MKSGSWICCLVCLWFLPVGAVGQEKKLELVRVKEKLPDRVAFHPDLVFAQYGERKLRLDLFLPKEAKGPLPAIVFAQRSRGSGGNKTEYRPMAQQFAAQGYVCVCIEHRFSNEAKFPAAVQDCKAAVRWLRALAEQYQIDSSR